MDLRAIRAWDSARACRANQGRDAESGRTHAGGCEFGRTHGNSSVPDRRIWNAKGRRHAKRREDQRAALKKVAETGPRMAAAECRRRALPAHADRVAGPHARGSEDARDKRGSLRTYFADADDVCVARHTNVADIDVVTAGGEIETGIKAQRDVAAARGEST